MINAAGVAFLLGVLLTFPVGLLAYAWGWHWRGRWERPYIDQMIVNLHVAERAFDHYGDLHSDKQTPDGDAKAERNRYLALMMERARQRP
jgi:hypothetical protein